MDTLSIARELRAADLPQADAIAAAIGRSVEEGSATKADLENFEQRARAEFERVRGEMGRLHSQLLTWFIGTQVAVGALIVALIKL